MRWWSHLPFWRNYAVHCHTPKVRKYIKTSDEDLDLWVASIELIAQPVDGDLRIHAVAADPDDNKYIEAAVEGLAQFVVTGDKHLLSLKSYENIRILTPRLRGQVLFIVSKPVCQPADRSVVQVEKVGNSSLTVAVSMHRPDYPAVPLGLG